MDASRPFRHLCLEAELRESLDDGDFWEYVFHGRLPGDPRDPDWDGEGTYEPDEPDVLGPAGLCEVCGAVDEACGYDEEGRPWVHCVPADEGRES